MGNKRQDQRLHAFWKIFKGNANWGYLIDLSTQGVKVWINKEEELTDDNFEITIQPPKELQIESIVFMVHRIWMNTEKSPRFNEIGCQFTDISEKQNELLGKLFSFFQKYNPDMNLKQP